MSNVRRDGKGIREKAIGKRFPKSTPAERRRYLIARNWDVEATSLKISNYLAWRDSLKLDDITADEVSSDELDPAPVIAGKSNEEVNGSLTTSVPSPQQKQLPLHDWRWAAMVATSASNSTVTKDTSSNNPKISTVLPQMIFAGGDHVDDSILLRRQMKDLNGNRIFQVMAPKLDPTMGSPLDYATALAIYMDKKLDRNSMDKICVVLDVRGKDGWANPAVTSIISSIKAISGLLNDHFPERLDRLVLFPLPTAAKFFWNVVKNFLDPDTARKIQVISGPSERDSPAPMAELSQFIDADTIKHMELLRESL